jgi:ABC-type transporter Mla subunit MlaD
MRRGQDRRRVSRKDRTGASPFKVGLISVVFLSIVVYLGFTKALPLTHDFRLNAVFESANSIRANSPVRIAGVNVGKVTGVRRQDGSNTSVVEMEIKDAGLPIHKDATAKIRPRIFLEGNFFVDLKPGTPSSPKLDDQDTLEITQTATPVQLDQVLTALQGDTREELKEVLDGYGTALTYEPTEADDRGQDPIVRGETAARSLNDAFKYGEPALKNTAIVNDALLGVDEHDLSRLVRSTAKIMKGLGRDERQLQDLVTNFNTTMASFASERVGLRKSIRLLAPTLANADRALGSLNAAFPETRAFAREILPGVRETPATITASFPWITQTRRLLGRDELRGLAQNLRPATANLSAVVDGTVKVLPEGDLAAQCATKVVLPTGDIKIDEGSLSTGAENYKEFWYAMVGLAGESQNFDGNGQYVRFQPGGGDQTVQIGGGANVGDALFGNATDKPLGTRPRYPGKRPPYVSDQPCKDQKIPDVNGAKVGPPDGGGRTPAQPRSSTAAPQARGLTANRESLTAQIVSRLNPFRGERP